MKRDVSVQLIYYIDNRAGHFSKSRMIQAVGFGVAEGTVFC
jgi:hypothetical protein